MAEPRLSHGAVRGRLRGPVQEPRGGRAALEEVRAWVAEQRPAAAPGQDACRRLPAAGQGFEFLGYRFEAGRRFVRKKSLATLQGQDPSKTGRTRGDSLERDRRRSQPDAARLVRLLQARPSAHLTALDGFIRRRLRSLLLQAGEADTASGSEPLISKTLAKCLLRGCRAARSSHGLANARHSR